MDEEICSNSYNFNHARFDNRDGVMSGKLNGSMHGPVKIYNEEEIADFNEARQHELENQ